MNLSTIILSVVSLTEPVNKVNLINAIAQVESSGNPNAVGDNGLAVGILQIHPITVKDANRILGREKFKLEDRKSVEKSIEIFYTITNHYTPDWNPEKVARRWNGGPKGDTKQATLGYWNKVRSLINGY
jgi:hypothetical protein